MIPGQHTVLPHHNWSWRRGAWAAYVQLLKRTDWPILVGPWHGELGFEVLYWIPFLEHLKTQGIAADRLIPITRGGAGAWYGCPLGLELYAMRSPQQVRIERRLQQSKTGLQKQVTMTPWDRAVLRDAAETMKLARYHVLHPAWMYHVYAPYWTGRRGPLWLSKRSIVSLLPAPTLPESITVPEPFVAVKFYGRETWPLMDKAVRAASAATMLKLAEQSPVIVLESETVSDEHMDFPVPSHPNLIRLRDLTTLRPETNLLIQSAIVGKAQGFVGTYGGFAQLALRLGKPSVSFYHEWGGTAITHKLLADVLSTQYRIASYTVRLGEIPMLEAVLPQADIRPTGKQLDTRLLTPA